MDPAEHLPVELLRRIIELAAAATTDDTKWRRLAKLNTLFRSLALVSHSWEEVSRPFLYANIILEGQEQADLAESLMRTLKRRPERTALVKTLELGHDPVIGTTIWQQQFVLYTLERCLGLIELQLGGENEWWSAWDAALTASSVRSLKLRWITFSVAPSTFPSLRILALSFVNLPEEPQAFSKCFPSVVELSVHFAGNFRQESAIKKSAILQFVASMAPQLVTLRLRYGTRGVPFSFIHQIISTGIHLNRLDSTVISSDHSSSASPLILTPLTVPELPPLELRFILYSASSHHTQLDESLPPLEQLWALFKFRDAGATQAIASVRRVERVLLEPWLEERFCEGVEYAVVRMKKQGFRLEFDRPDVLYE